MMLKFGGQGSHLTQEDVSIKACSLNFIVGSLVHQFREVSPHADVYCLPHLRRQRPHFLLVLLQGLLINLQTQLEVKRLRMDLYIDTSQFECFQQ